MTTGRTSTARSSAPGATAAARSRRHTATRSCRSLQRRDITTQVRWGLADFAFRFGRPAEGMWLPETGVNDEVLSVLAEEGVGFTILAPSQAVRVRLRDAGDDEWVSVDDGSIDTRRTYQWCHPSGDGRGVTIVFYDGGLSHDVAFGLGSLSSAALVDRAEHLLADSGDRGVVCIATDGETFGHHHRWGERAVAYTLAVEAPRRGLPTGGLAELALGRAPEWEVQVRRARGRARTALVGGRRIAAATPAEDQGGTKPGGLRCEPRSIASAITVSRCSSAAAARCCTTRGPPATPMWT